MKKNLIPHSVSRRPCQPIRDGRTLNIILGPAIVHGGWRKGGQGEIEFPSNQEERSRRAPAPAKERKERGEKRNGLRKDGLIIPPKNGHSLSNFAEDIEINGGPGREKKKFCSFSVINY
ncbi:hypothetical protein NPIL_681901 [Nephila pilipes]|uniref:Uncharacterized protein n=1 Tax=Nephila pilipes TaxID=299642 RepID=A0A8X6TTX9_NEPPI|nr:hypothetical protein NPIL_681901 [Nephila pilipes]